MISERAGMSKQAMNQLLRSLEVLGYIPDILRDIEREWIAELGPKQFADLKTLLTRVWESPLPG